MAWQDDQRVPCKSFATLSDGPKAKYLVLDEKFEINIVQLDDYDAIRKNQFNFKLPFDIEIRDIANACLLNSIARRYKLMPGEFRDAEDFILQAVEFAISNDVYPENKNEIVNVLINSWNKIANSGFADHYFYLFDTSYEVFNFNPDPKLHSMAFDEVYLQLIIRICTELFKENNTNDQNNQAYQAALQIFHLLSCNYKDQYLIQDRFVKQDNILQLTKDVLDKKILSDSGAAILIKIKDIINKFYSANRDKFFIDVKGYIDSELGYYDVDDNFTKALINIYFDKTPDTNDPQINTELLSLTNKCQNPSIEEYNDSWAKLPICPNEPTEQIKSDIKAIFKYVIYQFAKNNNIELYGNAKKMPVAADHWLQDTLDYSQLDLMQRFENFQLITFARSAQNAQDRLLADAANQLLKTREASLRSNSPRRRVTFQFDAATGARPPSPTQWPARDNPWALGAPFISSSEVDDLNTGLEKLDISNFEVIEKDDLKPGFN